MSAAIEALVSLQTALGGDSLEIGPYVERATDALAEWFGLSTYKISSSPEIKAMTIGHGDGPVTYISHWYASWMPDGDKGNTQLQLAVAADWWTFDVFETVMQCHTGGDKIGPDDEPILDRWQETIGRWKHEAMEANWRARMADRAYWSQCYG